MDVFRFRIVFLVDWPFITIECVFKPVALLEKKFLFDINKTITPFFRLVYLFTLFTLNVCVFIWSLSLVSSTYLVCMFCKSSLMILVCHCEVFNSFEFIYTILLFVLFDFFHFVFFCYFLTDSFRTLLFHIYPIFSYTFFYCLFIGTLEINMHPWFITI